MSLVRHDLFLILLAITVLSLACYAAIDVLDRVTNSRAAMKWVWTGAGSLVLASGLWSMTYLLILAAQFPFALRCSVGLSFAAWVCGFTASIGAYSTASRTRLRGADLLRGATFCLVVLLAHYYFAIHSLRIQPAAGYELWVDSGIVVFVYAVCLFGIGIGYVIRDAEQRRSVGATILLSVMISVSLAVCEMLAISHTVISPQATSTAQTPLSTYWLTPLIAITMLITGALTMIVTGLDRRLHRNTAALLTSLRASNEQLEYSSRHDPLTDLPNRIALYAHLEKILHNNAPDPETALFSIDLDGFRLINDTLGHVVGDRLLQQAARAIRLLLDERHVLARVASDEFMIVQHGIRDEREILELANVINDRLARISEHGATLTASIGIAVYPNDAADAVSLISASDMAMYVAKRSGKNQSQRYLEHMGAERNETFRIREDLRRGIANDELVVYYQPKYSVFGSRLVGTEALVRWQHPEHGLVTPGYFIEIAERSGQIRDIELRVIDLVCAQIRAWRDTGLVVPPVSVNLSVARLLDERLVAELGETLPRYGLSPSDLIFEITETLAMQEFDVAKRVLRQLNELGADIALDDFGTGYSSLSYLQTLPIQQLKIDRSFIANIEKLGSSYEKIVKLIIDLAHVLDLVVVAEGIETAAQRDALGAMGCDQLQGFFLDRPMPADQLCARLQHAAPSPVH